jgi:hypothetical protein
VIAAGQVIEFIAKVAVPIVEVEMQQEVCEGECEDDSHPIREERRLLVVLNGRLISSHFCVDIYGT